MAVEEEPTHPPVDKLTTVLYALSGYCSIDWLYNVILSVTILFFFFFRVSTRIDSINTGCMTSRSLRKFGKSQNRSEST